MAGIGGAAIIPLAIAWLGDVIPYERRQPILARFASGQILGVVFGQAAGGILGEFVGWRGALLLVGVAHIAAGIALALEMRRLTIGVPPPGRARWREAALAAYAILSRPWPRILLGTTFVEGVLMFGAFAYVGAHLQSALRHRARHRRRHHRRLRARRARLFAGRRLARAPAWGSRG